ncbi:MAG: hypothetical protein CO093_04590 [Alphaproteobacteria bacterium CG_4_9_14_3_um_filter_47_13]|nr:MAG: hypothetical protein CO093_04590 [Alphaproteobacteria bacterium CG_4_9_14_3_um_filter_47_13]
MKKLEPVVKQEKETRLSTSCEKDIEILARTIWGEARGEGQKGMLAVASVIMNRVRCGGWWGSTIQDVCRKPYQLEVVPENRTCC